MRKFLSIYTVFAFIIVNFNCTPAVKIQSIVDTPRDHYKSGMQKLKANDHAAAETEFLRAVELDKNSPFGYTGMAFLELSRSNYKKALKNANKAIKKDRDFVDAYTAKGHIIATRKHGDKWFEKAFEPFKKALELDPENERVLYYLAEYYYEIQEYEQALMYYSIAREKKGDVAEQSNNKIIHVTKMMKAEHLSDKGSIIADRDKINRADFCVLLIEELKLKNFIKRKHPELFKKIFNEDYTLKTRKIKVKPEVGNNEANEWILEIIQIDIQFLDLYPDGYFYPDRLVTKSHFAVVIQEVLALISGYSSFSTKYIGIDSKFNDVHSDYYAFNAINLCIEMGIMEAPEDGIFNSDSTISGIDAILMLRIVEDILSNS